ncbi:hypothetical protein CR970_03770 [Candidatus Saccharibacteria bacterium]|nr:MAG: hypothetical protein CR970_03770 [Candidatus Saccharibacteria bacterium]
MYQEPGTTRSAIVIRPLQRIRWWYVALLLIAGLAIVRLFYLQVIRHNYYQLSAYSAQLKQYEVPANRGIISAYDGNTVVPLVLNETLFTLYADPSFVDNPQEVATALQPIIGGNVDDIRALAAQPDTRYVVLAKKLTREQKDRVDALELKGIGTQDAPYRTYPDGALAAQLLGFVNAEGKGTYGIEQALDEQLRGVPGALKAVTDVNGVPLPANSDNKIVDPVPGDNVTLTLDIGLQQQVEDTLRDYVAATQSETGSVVVLEAETGAVKAMANYPTYDPANYAAVEDAELFTNPVVSQPLEVGSIMKTLTVASAIDQGLVTAQTTYYDPGFYQVDDATIKNVEEDGGAGSKSMEDLLRLSLNTGATWLLMQMGGGEINQQARERWYDYLVKHYQLGQETGIEQGYEATGFVPEPNDGWGLNITYANTAFGQGVSATMLQMSAAFAAALNGGIYYQPHLVATVERPDGAAEPYAPRIVREGVVDPSVSSDMQNLLETVFRKNRRFYTDREFSDAYSVGGKTGTAQIAKPDGGYYDDRFNGTYLGFVGGDRAEYIIAVRMTNPRVAGYAGTTAAAPVFGEVATMLINNFGVSPRSQ